MRDSSSLIGALLVLGLVCLVVYIMVLAISALVTIAGGAGLLWGGGTALVNYCKSFKENMIDSNLAVG